MYIVLQMILSLGNVDVGKTQNEFIYGSWGRVHLEWLISLRLLNTDVRIYNIHNVVKWCSITSVFFVERFN